MEGKELKPSWVNKYAKGAAMTAAIRSMIMNVRPMRRQHFWCEPKTFLHRPLLVLSECYKLPFQKVLDMLRNNCQYSVQSQLYIKTSPNMPIIILYLILKEWTLKIMIRVNWSPGSFKLAKEASLSCVLILRTAIPYCSGFILRISGLRGRNSATYL